MPWTLDQASRLLLDNGIMFSISMVFLWALGLAVYLAYKVARRKFLPTPDGHFRACDGCAYADELRSPQELVGHRLFGYIRLARASLLPNLPIPDPGRRALFLDLLDARFRIVSETYLMWLKANLPGLETMRADMLASEQLRVLGDIVEAFEAEARRLGVPSIVMERLRYWEGPRIGHLRSEIQLVCESEWIADSLQRLGFILSVVEQVLKATVLDAERTLGSLNGQLTGIAYRGYIVGPCARRPGESGPYGDMQHP